MHAHTHKQTDLNIAVRLLQCIGRRCVKGCNTEWIGDSECEFSQTWVVCCCKVRYSSIWQEEGTHETCVIIVGLLFGCEPRTANTAPQLANFNCINIDLLPKVETGCGALHILLLNGYRGVKHAVREECVELYFHSAMYLRGVHRDNFAFYFNLRM